MTTPTRSDTSKQLFKSAWWILRREPKLLIFPVVTLAFFVVVALFFAPWDLLARAPQPSLPAHGDPFNDFMKAWENNLLSAHYIYLAIFYVLSMFVSTFGNVAFYHEIFRALNGEAVSLRGGLRFACQRLRTIALWVAFASSVGIGLRFLNARLNLVGRIATALLGMSWSVAAVFVIPAIIRSDQASPLALLRHSALTLKKTWGESILGYGKILQYGFAAPLCVSIILTMVMFIGLSAAFPSQNPGKFIPYIVLVSTLVPLTTSWAMVIARKIYFCALYIYASEGIVPEPFTPELMDAAWKVKKP